MWRRLPGRRFRPPNIDWVVFGLGNPGQEYEATRHNVGRQAAMLLARRWGVKLDRAQHGCRWTVAKLEEHWVCLAVPLVYMNEAGRPLASLLRALAVGAHQLLVLSDDMDLPLGAIRIRRSGGSGGHRGLESVIAHLATTDFARLRIGIGRPPPAVDPVDYVLASFSAAEKPVVLEAIERAAWAVEAVVRQGLAAAMNTYNRPLAQVGLEQSNEQE